MVDGTYGFSKNQILSFGWLHVQYGDPRKAEKKKKKKKNHKNPQNVKLEECLA